MAFAACNKTEVVYLEGPQEISFTAVSKVATKAPVAGTGFLSTDDMYVAAYIAAGATTKQDFFEKTHFRKEDGATYFTGDPARYWPLTSSTINFLAVTKIGGGAENSQVSFPSPYASKAEVTLSDNSAYNQNDLMYAVGQGTRTQGSHAPTKVDMVFKHALAWVNFKVAKNDVSSVITVNSIKLNNAYYSGTLTVTNSEYDKTTAQAAEAEWDDEGTQKNVFVPNAAGNDTAAPVTLTTTGQAFGNGILVVPGTATSITINYTVDSNTFEATYDLPTGTWDMAKKYTYNVTISLNEIQINPSVTDWTTVTPATDVPL